MTFPTRTKELLSSLRQSQRPTVAVLMGGPSAEHEISLVSGTAMVKALREAGFDRVRRIVVGRDHRWMLDGKPVSVLHALEGVETALLAFHGEWGEDGQAQALMEWFAVPYSGSGPTASALGMDKPTSRSVFHDHGLATPKSEVYDHPEGDGGVPAFAAYLSQRHAFPFVVKPARRGSSVGVSVVHTSDGVVEAVANALRFDTRLLVEEYLSGIEVSCGVLEEESGELRALPVVQIVPPENHTFFDYEAKYSGETAEIIPASIPDHVARHVQNVAMTAHKALGCRHYSRTDMIIVHEMPVVLELNTLPGLTPESLFPKEAAAAGISFPALMERFVTLALRDG